MNVEAIERRIIETYLGAPYRNRGRDPKTGIDCWGLILGIYEIAGAKIFDIPSIEYDIDWSKKGGNYLAENLWREWERIETPDFLDGVLFQNMEGVAYHGGVILRDSKFIHATKRGVIVSRLSDPMIFSRVEGFYRLKKLYEQ